MANYLDKTGLTLVLTKIKTEIDKHILSGALKTINNESLEGSGNISLITAETDPIFGASAAAGITSAMITAWNNASANAASQITAEMISTWNSKLSSESDPVFLASPASGISADMITGWDSAASNSHTHSNKTVLDGITSTNVTNWGTAYTNSHTHSNKSVLDGITSALVTNWSTAYTNNHVHSNKTALDNITQDKINAWDGAVTASHTHTNSTVLAGISSTDITAWNAKLDASALTGYATESYVTTEIGKMTHLEFQIVTSLDDVTATNKIYLIKDTTAQTNDAYTEYALIGGKAEMIGSTKVDIASINTEDINTILTTTGFLTAK